MIQLALLLLTYIVFNVRNYSRLHEAKEDGLYDSQIASALTYAYDFAQILFMLQHWLFTIQYLKVALIFELAFCVKTEEVQKKKMAKESSIVMINLAAGVFFVGYTVLLLIYQEKITMITFMMVGMLAITICLTFSLVRLNKFSKMLTAEGYLASQFLIYLHLGSFWCCSLLYIASFVVNLMLDFQTSQGDFSNNGLALARSVTDTIILLTLLVIMVTMMIMYVRFGTPLSSAQNSSMKMRLLEEFNQDLHGSPQSREKQEREQAQRRQKHFQELADYQIQDILATLISVSANVKPRTSSCRLGSEYFASLAQQETEVDDDQQSLADSNFFSETSSQNEMRFHNRFNELTDIYCKRQGQPEGEIPKEI